MHAPAEGTYMLTRCSLHRHIYVPWYVHHNLTYLILVHLLAQKLLRIVFHSIDREEGRDDVCL